MKRVVLTLSITDFRDTQPNKTQANKTQANKTNLSKTNLSKTDFFLTYSINLL